MDELETRSYRTKRGRKRHALPRDGGGRLMCGRASSGLLVDDALPDCRGCLRAIAAEIEREGS